MLQPEASFLWWAPSQGWGGCLCWAGLTGVAEWPGLAWPGLPGLAWPGWLGLASRSARTKTPEIPIGRSRTQAARSWRHGSLTASSLALRCARHITYRISRSGSIWQQETLVFAIKNTIFRQGAAPPGPPLRKSKFS